MAETALASASDSADARHLASARPVRAQHPDHVLDFAGGYPVVAHPSAIAAAKTQSASP